jgi:hypothetical protein
MMSEKLQVIFKNIFLFRKRIFPKAVLLLSLYFRTLFLAGIASILTQKWPVTPLVEPVPAGQVFITAVLRLEIAVKGFITAIIDSKIAVSVFEIAIIESKIAFNEL